VSTAAASASSSWRGNPVEFTFAILGFLVALACLPAVLLLDAPFNGWILGFVLFAAYWAGGIVIGKATQGLSPTHAVGVAGIAFIARVWVVFGVLLVVSLKVSRDAGVTAMLVFAAAFTFDMLGRTVLHSLRQKAHEQGVDL
jgi:hypothetical protein